MAAKLKDIAEAAGVSINTASDILNRGRHELYRPETCRRVLDAGRQFNYRPNRSAQAMRSNKTRVVGFGACNFSATSGLLENRGAYPFLIGMSHRLTEQHYHVGLVELGGLQLRAGGELPAVLQERFFDGLVLHYGLSADTVEVARQLDIPAVWWDSGVVEPTGCIYRDEVEAARLATRSLIELGHRRIALFLSSADWAAIAAGATLHHQAPRRAEGFRAALRDHGLPERYIAGFAPGIIRQRLQDDGITAVVTCGADEVPQLIEAASGLGLRVPADLSIAVCDREARIPSSGATIAGVPYDRYAAGRQAAEMLLATLAAPGTPVPSVKLACEFVRGDTVATAPATSR